MLYNVEYELVSWGGGMTKYLVELSIEERDQLVEYFEKESARHKLFGYRITVADIKSLENLLDIHKGDVRDEEELDKRIDEEEKSKKGA